jgi:hypothetical protein
MSKRESWLNGGVGRSQFEVPNISLRFYFQFFLFQGLFSYIPLTKDSKVVRFLTPVNSWVMKRNPIEHASINEVRPEK